MSSPTPSYIPYTPKRHSTQSSIASLSQLQSQQSSSYSHSSSSRASSHTRNTSSIDSNNGYLGFPVPQQPQRSLSAASTGTGRPGMVNHPSNSSTTSSSTGGYQAGRSPLNAPSMLHSSTAPVSGGGGRGGGTSSTPTTSTSSNHSPRPFSPPPSVHASSSRPLSPSPSTHSSPTKQPQQLQQHSTGGRKMMPYIQTFQPPGVKRDRTEEFLRVRKGRRREKAGEEERLERRVDKLLELHFPLTPTSEPSTSTINPTTTLASLTDPFRSSPSLSSSAKELFKLGVTNFSSATGISTSATFSAGDLEKEEQKLVTWEEDRNVKECRICSASFGLLTRKHHCRLCGRIVCFLPPTPPTSSESSTSSLSPSKTLSESTEKKEPSRVTRKERCSTFFTYIPSDSSTSLQGPSTAEKEKGVVTGTKKRRRKGLIVEIAPIEQDRDAAKKTLEELMSGSNNPSAQTQGGKKVEKEKEKKDERKKVRICRDCLNTVLRHQFSTLPLKTPNWLKLYRVLKQLEEEIDLSLQEFQELIVRLQGNQSDQSSLSSPPPSKSQTSSLRARLITNLASYDTLSKRLLSLSQSQPSSTSSSATGAGGNGGGGELERLQKALGTRSMNWLNEKLSLLRSLGSIEEISGKASSTKKKEAGEEAAGTKSLESLLSEEELRKVRERIGEVGGADGGSDGKLLRLGPENEEEETQDGQLGVLLEQEKLVQSYLEDANSRRQFEDAASLQSSLDELRREIERLRMG
ncbi:uncharacterized protein JCM6883_002821 [Sporobolomyces salmoneus]|uniref:uncharacterized protein n=1 Tax=Sporobolomyces salmoneus TaxID=183962 RepID=UPI00317D6EE4